MTKVPEANVQTKRTKGEQKRKRREELRRSKEKIEGNWKETSLLRYAHVSYILSKFMSAGFYRLFDQPKQVHINSSKLTNILSS